MNNKSKLVKSGLPCPCGVSSDAFSIYSDNHGFCFSGNCKKPYFDKVTDEGVVVIQPKEEQVVNQQVSYQIVPIRGLSENTMKKFKLRVKVLGDKPYSIEAVYPTFIKGRELDRKTFYISGERVDGLFGKEAFPQGTFDTIIVTEGDHFDAPSSYQMTGIASVSVQSSSQALKDCQKDYGYLNSAKRIILALDNDEPGEKASKAIASLFPFEKVFRASLSAFKDANEYLVSGNSRQFQLAIQNAKKYVPDGVISSYGEIEEALLEDEDKPFVALPFSILEDKLEGLRFGCTYLFSGLEGIGKTEILRALEYQIIKETDYNIGIIHIEENKRRVIRNLTSYELEIPLKRQSTEVSNEEVMKHYKKLTKRDNRVFIYSHFGSSDPDDFLQIVRFLVTVCGCKIICFDHINILVSGLNVDADERRLLDYVSTRLATMAEELEFCLLFICHENDDGLTRGSRNMSQTAHVHVRLSRNTEDSDPEERKKLYFSVKKNRPVGPSGPSGYAIFDEDKGKLIDPEIYAIKNGDNFLPHLPQEVSKSEVNNRY